MFLKRLEIAGFKSFAEKVSIDFVPGVTAVVGPNGSGKSNITDAIRWVLGEQSVKSLRGAKMEDVIFAGSDSRRALNVAEVTLTLDNEDERLPVAYSEVSVTRRVYRSGESDFFINKQSCRLKDIVDLFMDSGMGREAFSIISQGKVEQILSSKAEDRRSIFEEAAGVLKYKTRKKKAEVKLEETQENLHRVEDIIHELSAQIEPLRMQASAAKDYLEQKEVLEQVEAALIVHEIEELHQKWEKLLAELEQNKERELQLATKLQKDEAFIEELRSQVQAVDESVASLQEVLLLTSKELEKLEGQRELLKERKKNASAHSVQLQESIDTLASKLAGYEASIVSENQVLHRMKEHVAEIKQKLEEKEIAIANLEQNLDEQIESLKADYIEILNEQAGYRNELVMLEEQAGQYAFKNKRLDEENAKYLQLRSEVQAKKERLILQYQEMETKTKNTMLLLRETENALEQRKKQCAIDESKLYQAYQFLQQMRSRKEMLEEMQEDYTGFYQGVREVLKARGSLLQGIEGAVAELIAVPQKYEIAIETTLGAAMQHVVVETEAHGRAAIAFLKTNQYGRATFLPLSVIKGKQIGAEVLHIVKQHATFLGVAADLVQYDPKYKAIVYNLLGTVLVTADLKGANELARLVQYRYRIVTLEGDIVNPGGAMTGGAVKQARTSLLGRQRELEVTTEKLKDMEIKTHALEEQVRQAKREIEEKEILLAKLRQQLDEIRPNEQKLVAELAQVESEEQRVNERLSMYDLEMEGFQEDEFKVKERQSHLKDKLAIIQKNLQNMDENLAKLTKRKQEQAALRDRLQAEITDLKVQHAQQQQRLSNQQEKTIRLREEQKETAELLTKTQEDLLFLKQEMNSNSSGEQQIEKRIMKKAQDSEQTTELISTRRKQRFEMQGKLESLELETRETKRNHKYLLDVTKDQEVQANRLDVELENRLQHLREEYGVSFEAAKIKYPMLITAEEARKKVRLVKTSIEELGTVNLGAIDEYDRVSERYTFLLTQRDDLREAKETLHQVIGEMDEEMKKRFSFTFEAIRAEFQFIFKELFGGGRADLVMTDAKDILHTGVDIVAQPPGKKLQNLGLLSGGERALTAIALLFAILKVRPVPFCVLDEVEAALDEANVARFAQYLKRFSNETQFIVITHRKGTMEECDVLYGVTMQESGVSRLVSVRLDEPVINE
ncbi:chromosome segregation protein SMC [Ectobacillus antri]|uniref:Chromosome partition protein Smc n=1 Tax=Ectobacillus antri TaxID=2486280 RepID=A0ABT6GZT9_9BACI|nr:chromosome segregation protein SMC [Ectobacillus antri]MDG4655905.1 chromosome segregation protein SMC [Ectobacillus antri]MDG5752580.1 chromosome segregation protein SMC [Ectobacillus antri]